MNNRQLLKLGIGFFFFCLPIFSETVLLRNGTILKGKLKTQGINDIVIIINDSEQRISKDKIFRVLYRDLSQTEARKTLVEEIKKLNPKEREKMLSELNDKSIASSFEKKPVDNSKTVDEKVEPVKESKTVDEKVEPVKESKTANEKVEPVKESKNANENLEVAKSSKTDKEKIEVITKWSYVWRSALIPGWGHIKAKHYKTGFLYGTLFFGTGIFAASMSTQLNSAIKDRDEKIRNNTFFTLGLGRPDIATLLFAGTASDTTSEEQKIFAYRATLYASLGGLSAIYIIQLMNAYITGVSLEKTKQTGFNFYTMPEYSTLTKEIGVQHNLTYTFSF